MWHDSFLHVPYFISMCDMTHFHVWHDSFLRVPWMSHVTHIFQKGEAFQCVTWPIRTCDMNESCHIHVAESCVTQVTEVIAGDACVWQHSLLRVTWMSHVAYMLQEGETYRGREGDLGIDVCDMTHCYVCHDCVMSHTCCRRVRHTQVILVLMCVPWLIATCDMNESCHIHVAGGWGIHRLWRRSRRTRREPTSR